MFAFIHKIWFKRFKMLLYWIAFTTISIHFVLETPLRLKIIGAVGIVFFGIGGIFALYKSLIGKTNVDENGIYINGDFIKWANVTEIEKIRISKEEMLVVRTNDYDQRLAQATNIFDRWILRSNYKRFGGFLFINNLSVDGTLDDFQELCIEYKKQSSKQEASHIR